MIRNYIKISIRNIQRNKLFTLINIFGLSVGVACCLLLALYIQEELSYDKHFDKAEDIYRVTSYMKNDTGKEFRLASCSGPLAWGIKDRIPEIGVVTRIFVPPGSEQSLIKFKDNKFYETNGYMVDSTFFKVFDYQFTEGNARYAMKESNAVVIGQALKNKLFGSGEALGKIIEIENGRSPAPYKVTGVIKESTKKSHLKINYLLSMHGDGWGRPVDNTLTNWVGNNLFFAYLRLMPGSDVAGVETQINEILQENGAQEMKVLGLHKVHRLQRLADIHLRSDFDFIDLGVNGNIRNIYMLSTIAMFILVIACINFMNLATANANKRSNEVGIRKVMGAERKGLIGQFLGESLIMVLIAILFSVLWVELLLPLFNTLTQRSLSFGGENLPFFLAILLVTTFVTGILSGSYPAFYLSSFQPASVLKAGRKSTKSNDFFRKHLVIFQFVISITLVGMVVVINQQLSYLENKDLGFNAKSKVVIPLRNNETRRNYKVLLESIKEKSFVTNACGVDAIPGSTILDDMILYPKGSNSENGVLTKFNYIDHGFLKMMDMDLLAGRRFTDNRAVESQSKIIINRKAVENLGFNLENAVGQIVSFNWADSVFKQEIIGVIENFHQLSLHEDIMPLALGVLPQATYNAIIIEAKSAQTSEIVASLQDTWQVTNSQTPFEYWFLDDHIQKQYDEDRSTSAIITYFTALAILISCLGLYGLSLYSAEQRVKEIGIRKIMGATSVQILRLLSRDFGKLTLIAFILSIPVSYFTMTKWLENFSYRIDISLWVFASAGLMALIITQITISFHAVRASMANPVDSLRNE